MKNYNFYEKLDWEDFQNLACEIIQVRENILLQTFKAGPDEGIDGLWFNENSNIIVQVKRYKDFKSLYQVLKNSELSKVQKLNPDRYILVISLKLGKSEAFKIFELFEGYIKESRDLVSRNELNSLLTDPKYRFIERSYTKLWLPES